MRRGARKRPRVVRLTPSFAETCLPVSIPASSRRSLRVLSLTENRTHRTLSASNVVPAPVVAPLVQDGGALSIGVLVEQGIYMVSHRRVGGA
jgi:hypothetical protein